MIGSLSKSQVSITLSCLLMLLLAPSMPYSTRKSFAQTTQAEWTLMFYMDLDNNLESAQLDDIDEMLAVGSTKDVNIVLLVDRSNESSPEQFYTSRAVGRLKNWTTAKLLYVEKGSLRELGDWGEVNMGSPATLKKFLQTVTQQFPAQRYGIIFTDHGAGWSGIVGDESANNDTLTTKELPIVFKEVGKTFDLIGFDACLMGNLEVAKSVAPFGRVMVGSEELEPADGWNYTPLFRSLTANPKMDEITLGKTIVNTYADYFKSPEQARTGKGVTLSVIALDKIEPLERAVNELGVRNQTFIKTGGRTAFLSTARARKNTEELGNDSKNDYRYHYYDLGDYAQNIKKEKTNAETIKAADAVVQAMQAAVIHKHSGQGHPNSSGLAIFFPPDTKTLKSKSEISYKDTPFSLTGKWLPFLNDYTNIRLADKDAPQIENLAVAKKTTGAKNRFGNTTFAPAKYHQPFLKNNRQDDVATVTARIKGDDIDEIYFVLAETDGREQLIYGTLPTEPDEKGMLREEWNGAWLKISDGKKELFAPITDAEPLDDEDELFWIEIPAQVRLRDDDEWIDVTLYFLLDTSGDEFTGEFIYAFEFSDDGVREIELDEGDLLRPVYIFIDENGDEDFVVPRDANDILKIKDLDDLTLTLDVVEAGDYLLGFTVTDFAGNYDEEYEQWTIE
jgi:clostripain